MAKKYELTEETINYYGHILHRIKALMYFGNIKAGQLGGWIEKERNLSHEGICWVADNAKVFGDAQVCNDAEISGYANVYENARVSHSAKVFDNAEVYGNAVVSDKAKVFGKAEIYNDALVCGDAKVSYEACVYDDAMVRGYAQIFGHAEIYGHAEVYEYAEVYGNAEVYEYALVSGNAEVFGNAKVRGNTKVLGVEKVNGYKSTPKNNTKMEKKYKVSIDITMSKDIYVDAENEEKAKQKAIENAKENSYYLADSADSCVNCVVTNIVNEDENVRLWLISQLKIKLEAINTDKNDMINKALDYLEKQGGQSVK
jgi:carbonic anhydrase/acetyltransferase-like protein (isoleucine patch superfamily)